jgi:4-amino-4-deoxy-L-arabinose transferase-like glycosyltransferase
LAGRYNEGVPRRIPPVFWLAVPVIFVLYFYGLGASGLLGPDEPRYAAIGREMARSGDWVTPRLWGSPWFEKPALLYWMTAAGFRAGLGTELAPRLPVALLSVAFLWFYLYALRREFGARAAWFATAILAASAGWMGYSYVAVTDLPMSAAFSAAMLLALPWVARGDRRMLPVCGALLGAAVLAKGLVPLVLALPLVWAGRRRWRDLLNWRVILPFAAVALPWYALCYLRHGRPFVDKFFLEHHFGRFATGALQHRQPFWFYLPVLAAGLLPWTPLLAALFRRGLYGDERRRFLLAVAAFGLLFFSASTNKLPGYLLPLLPAAAALMGLALAEMRDARPWLAACAVASVGLLAATRILPDALVRGLSRAPLPRPDWTWCLPLLLAGAVWWLESRARRAGAVALLAGAFACGVFYLKTVDLPKLDAAASARPVWQSIAPRAAEVCVQGLQRSWRYGLNYYAGFPLPECPWPERPLVLGQVPPAPPRLDTPRLVP